MKKTLAALAVTAIFAAASAHAAGFKAGTYTASAPGIHGDVTVEVVFTADKIASVKVVKQSETQGIGTVAVEQLPGRIVDAQSPNVDGVTGASITTAAIKKAVSDCIRQAGADPEKLVPVVVNKAAKNEDLSTDVVIVGGGGSGMSATIRSRMNGLSVILVEKMPFIGGAASISGGQVVSQGSKLQKAFGSTDDSPQSMVEDFLKNGAGKNDLSKLHLYANNVGATIDWLHEKVGVKFIPNDLPFLAEYSHRRALEFQGGAGTMAQHLREVIAGNGAKVFYNTRVQELIVEDGAVMGVKAVDVNTGTTYTIRAKKTLLTTGGYGNNKDMLSPKMRNVLYYGPVSSTGDGLRMAQQLGVKTQLLQYGKRYPNGIEVAPGKAKSTIYANVGAFDQAGILVDVNGNRFVNEKASNRNILEPMLETPNGQAYVFMDQKSWEGFYKRLPETGVSHEDADRYLADGGKNPPLFVKADSIDEVAKLAGVNAANLKATVAKYNGFVKAGKDADFGRPTQYMKAEISAQGPYYIVEQKPRFATTMGGVCTDDKLNLIRDDGKVIPNLYGAGELVGGVMGDDSPAGANVGWALTSGRVAADSIAEAIKAGK
ncbi:FAD-dependent oxidoreductase [Sutterella sp.]|uniref:FAD-dependent oxidoreductase n=1 Tax=Sutterella sp. TaxID=1981025 RepID=UPI0026DFA497|nr:FAD-dependent oxidoreductase [Sutterella sp.]MDO5531805.1 FAD-dependent oxidoreductase [Sutterella sp.]